MLWEEGQIDAEERDNEVNDPPSLIVHIAGHLWEPIVERGEDAEKEMAGEASQD